MSRIKITPRKVSTSLMTERLALSKRETAAMLGVSERSLDNWTKTGEIKSRKIGNRVLFPIASINAFLDGVDTEQNH